MAPQLHTIFSKRCKLLELTHNKRAHFQFLNTALMYFVLCNALIQFLYFSFEQLNFMIQDTLSPLNYLINATVLCCL